MCKTLIKWKNNKIIQSGMNQNVQRKRKLQILTHIKSINIEDTI